MKIYLIISFISLLLSIVSMLISIKTINKRKKSSNILLDWGSVHPHSIINETTFGKNYSDAFFEHLERNGLNSNDMN